MITDLLIKSNAIAVAIPVQESEWIRASAARDAFYESGASEATSDLHLIAQLLLFLNKQEQPALVQSALAKMNQLVHPQNIHVVAKNLENRNQILQSYYRSFDSGPLFAPSAVLSSSSTRIACLFGGQGPNEDYLIELQEIYDIYHPFVEKMVILATEVLDLDVSTWLSTGVHPPVEYTASVPVSLPLIGLTQLCQYYVTCAVLGFTPGQMCQKFAGATGHSQGIISAVVVASSTSTESFFDNTKKALQLLKAIGARAQEAFPKVTIDPTITQDCVEQEGIPSSMLSVVGLSQDSLEKQVAATNSHLKEAIAISLYNGPKNYIVTGPARSLYGLVLALRKMKASPDANQGRIPYSQRKPVFTMRFLPVDVPFHSAYLSSCSQKVCTEDLEGLCLFESSSLSIPVYETHAGTNLQNASNLTLSICDQIFTQAIHWVNTISSFKNITHIVDFGPGGAGGIGPLTARNTEGQGVVVYTMNKSHEFFNTTDFALEESWESKWSPKLVKDSTGKIVMDTALSRLTGKPPLWGCGMTPSTVSGDFVAAVTNAGYSIELAGGGHFSEEMVRNKIDLIRSKVEPGQGIVLNCLYINPFQWGFQYPLWCKMGKEGIPTEGLTVAAGIPSLDVASKIINDLRESGIRYISFKPGSTDGLRQVCGIAAANPDYPIILQWTGGRAGGHHSFEDVHAPLLATYGQIRQNENIVLVVGSGLGTAEDCIPYMTGEWSEQYSAARMPCDGVLFGSRLMVAKECRTSEAAKNLIVEAVGVSDQEWEGTYTKETGGILTVRSELGEPIHKIANRGIKLWKEFDDGVFAMPKEKRIKWLKNNKQYVIDRLNKDFQKPWFARRKDGTVLDNNADMTYEDLTLRMVELMYVRFQNRWVDPSYKVLVKDFLLRTQERLTPFGIFLDLPNDALLQNSPYDYVSQFYTIFKDGQRQLITSEDEAFFLSLCSRIGSKPVPFIPVLDERFEFWFKKDSLWQSEDIDAVVDRDAGRVAILHGPVAVRHSVRTDEPVKDIFSKIEDGIIKHLAISKKVGTISIPLGTPTFKKVSQVSGICHSFEGNVHHFKVESTVAADKWYSFLSKVSCSWLSAFLLSPIVVRDGSYEPNPCRKILLPRVGTEIIIQNLGEDSKLYTSDGCVSVTKTADIVNVSLSTVFKVDLNLSFIYKPHLGFAPFHEIMHCRNQRIKEFYYKLWFGAEISMPSLSLQDEIQTSDVVKAEEVRAFCSVVKNFCPEYTIGGVVPIDFAIVVGWKAIMKALFSSEIDGDLLNLVHMGNSFRLLNNKDFMKESDLISTNAKVTVLKIIPAGKLVRVVGRLHRDGNALLEVTSEFLFRGKYTDYSLCFENVDEEPFAYRLRSKKDFEVLESKKWFTWSDKNHDQYVGRDLVFRVHSHLKYSDSKTYGEVKCQGSVFVKTFTQGEVQVATVDSLQCNVVGNEVVEFLRRRAKPLFDLKPLGNAYNLGSDMVSQTLVAPISNQDYAQISGDSNPIHVNPYFADLANLPATITHGMWTSAATRKFVDTIAAENNPRLVKAYDVKFVGMVKPGDILQVRLKHTAMRSGMKVISVQTVNEAGDVVLSGTAEVEQKRTAYVFTGQGSQEPGMGMELYQSSSSAKRIWDDAEAHLQNTYNFSILDIVRNNPKTKTVYFGGYSGQEIRERYMKMTYDTVDDDGHLHSLALFPEINDYTMSYTFSSPTGLLYSTQFAQIALVVTEKAAVEDMREKGLITDAVFAGHSLGEYAALASFSEFLTTAALCDVVFYRGLTMQRAVKRDEKNRSNYSMVALNPSRIGRGFDEASLRYIVDTVAERIGGLCQIVNFNVQNQQYVVAGELAALDALANTCNYFFVQKIDLSKLNITLSEDDIKSKLVEIVDGAIETSIAKGKRGFMELERGYATIPLQGIDIPFHSRHILSGVEPFRSFISRKIDPNHLNVDLLIDRYIPNLTAAPFSLKRSYFEMVFSLTQSEKIKNVLSQWEENDRNLPKLRQHLGYILLVELLSYQFASPVRWIETQDCIFHHFDVSRFIEFGPSPVLVTMASRTLKMKYQRQDEAQGRKRELLCVKKNAKEIYYIEEEKQPELFSDHVPEIAPAAELPLTSTKQAKSHAAITEVPDEPVQAKDILRSIVALKLKKSPTDIPMSKSIKDLVGGKSTLQNEILGDLQEEFSSAPEKGEELSLEELAAHLSMGHSQKLGKTSAGLIGRLVAQKFPGGFPLSAARTHLTKTWGLQTGRVDGVLVLGIAQEPPVRLASEVEAKCWLDSIAKSYANENGITLATPGGGESGGSSVDAMISSEIFEKFQNAQDSFAAQQIQVYMRYLGIDAQSDQNSFMTEKSNSNKLQAELDSIMSEHSEKYIKGIKPVFNSMKARRFDSSWNWVRQDAISMWYDIIFGRLTVVDREVMAKCIAIFNRSDPILISIIEYHIKTVHTGRGDTYQMALDLAERLLEHCEARMASDPKCKDVTFPTAPCTTIAEDGKIIYTEVNRSEVRKLESYVQEMARGSKLGKQQRVNLEKVQLDVDRLYQMAKQPQMSQRSKEAMQSLYGEMVRTLSAGTNPCVAQRNGRRKSRDFLRPLVEDPIHASEGNLPFLHLKRNTNGEWEYSRQLTNIYLDTLTEFATSGSTFLNTTALLTGCGRGSIGVEVLKGLLSGGCHVVVTTSSYRKDTVEFYQDLFQVYGARGSHLVVVPFNQASRQDVKSLVDYIYSDSGLNMDLDYVVPFAAISENGREVDGIDDLSELAHRLMLVNTVRLLGAIKEKKAEKGITTRPSQVLLPLSPNHGTFGGDGLYAESKIGLETLFNKWQSESWGQYISLVGAVIGWTRGTGLMNSTNIIAESLQEKYGVRTFSAMEMGFNILGLMHPIIASISSVEPIWADLSGGMLLLPDLQHIMLKIRKDITDQSEIRAAISQERSASLETLHGVSRADAKFQFRANSKFDFPGLKSYPKLQENLELNHPGRDLPYQLQGMVDLDKVVVIAGFAERWEMESKGSFSIAGCIELARTMGYVQFFNGRLKDGKPYIGWIDMKNDQVPISDLEIKAKYEAEILEHTGIRLIGKHRISHLEPEIFDGYDPKKKEYLHEIILEHDLEAFETSKEDALQFKLKHSNNVDIWPSHTEGWFVKMKKGASFWIPKSMPFDRLVAGQLPTGWDGKRFGLPQDIIDQVDPVTLWSLVSTADALASAGIADPYELFKYCHVSEIGNAIGSGMGGAKAMQGIFKKRFMGRDIQKDILQESFINTTAGWINLLLLSASGPIKTPVGACGTALQSLEIGIETIASGKAKVMFCGGVDDFSEEGSLEFANMKATSDSVAEMAKGRSPAEMSRPTTSTRSGFMEAQGAGVQVLVQAKLAIEMGLPIYGIAALTNTATDKQGRSVPAPGQGILSTAKESKGKLSPRLDLAYRKRQLEFRHQQIGQWLEHECQLLQDTLSEDLQSGESADEYLNERMQVLEQEAMRQKSEALSTWGDKFYQNDPSIAPLRGALAGFGLGIDDIGVVSFHGTSTVANDKNESDVTNKQFQHLGRSVGNSCPVIAQKWLTGHPKGAAAAWMANGLCQTLLSGLIPGNRNADNIAPELENFHYLWYPSRSLQTDGLKAGLMKSFGFGQVGGEALIIHPDYLLASLDSVTYEKYQVLNDGRWKQSYRKFQDAMIYENLIQIKDSAPYSPELESSVLLNPHSRAALDKTGAYTFTEANQKELDANAEVSLHSVAGSKGVGIDSEMLSALSMDNQAFKTRNFTPKEIAQCEGRPDPQASYTGRWCAKEAVVKAISSYASSQDPSRMVTLGSAAPLIDIEIVGADSGVPLVTLHGHAKKIGLELGIKNIKVSITHADSYAVAIAVIDG